MVLLYSSKARELSSESGKDAVESGLSHLKGKEMELLLFLLDNYNDSFTPIEVSRKLSVTNKTVINRLSSLAKNGFVEPIIVNERIRYYRISEFSRDNEKAIRKADFS